MIDELSVVVAPVADGDTRAVSIFEDSDGVSRPPVPYNLKEVKSFEKDGVWLRYLKK
ncbi:MAG: hypothetical protein NC223_09595 [Butyrivibrio sp.]|nr:hypothetical protein [Butyrivibrio sp.]